MRIVDDGLYGPPLIWHNVMMIHICRRPGAVVIALCMLFFFASCVDIVSEIELRTDGSGTIRLSYTAARAVVNLGTIDEKNRFYAVPISEDDFLAAAEKVEGLSLRSFKLDEEVDTLHIEATLDFESVGALSELFSSSGPGAVEVVEEAGTTTYRHVIYGGSGAEVDGDSRELIETFFSEDVVRFSLSAPKEIVSVNIGNFAGKEASVELTMTDILFSREQVIWEVRW